MLTLNGIKTTLNGIYMSFTLHLQDLENIIFESDNQQYTFDKSGTKELDISYNYHSLNGWYKELSFGNFKIGYGNNKLLKETKLLFDYNGETVEMHFTLKGASKTKGKNVQEFSIGNNSHNIFYCDGLKGKIEWFAKDIFVFEVNLSPSFFTQYLPNDMVFKKFKKQIQAKELGIMSKYNYPITPKMHIVIQQIMHCSLKNSFRKLFIESKVLELLMLQMEQIQFYKTSANKKEKTNALVVDKMHYARELILKKIDSPLSLSELSLALNTNECSLKKDFKAIFGTTVFGYIKELKMNKAKQLLLETNNTIYQISDTIGYKNPQHFTTAFKKHFGIPPSAFK